METNEGVNEVQGVQPLGAASGPRPEGNAADAVALRDALEDVVDSVDVFVRRANGFLARFADAQPQALVAGAAGIGFVLGGGLASRTGSALGRAGARLVLAHCVQRLAAHHDEAAQPHASTRQADPNFK
jgi:hypothetical protein